MPNAKVLTHFLNKAVEAYNGQKPHQALKGKSPIQFENDLKELSLEDRIHLKIFTISSSTLALWKKSIRTEKKRVTYRMKINVEKKLKTI